METPLRGREPGDATRSRGPPAAPPLASLNAQSMARVAVSVRVRVSEYFLAGAARSGDASPAPVKMRNFTRWAICRNCPVERFRRFRARVSPTCARQGGRLFVKTARPYGCRPLRERARARLLGSAWPRLLLIVPPRVPEFSIGLLDLSSVEDKNVIPASHVSNIHRRSAL